jgi:hypothetical protein
MMNLSDDFDVEMKLVSDFLEVLEDIIVLAMSLQ